MTHQIYDSHNMFTTIFKFAEQLEEALQLGSSTVLKNNYQDISQIVFAGMGGSAIAGDLVALLTAATARIPMLITRTYTVPTWVDEHTLIICISYSGNTEETLSAFSDARAKNARIIGITSGGRLAGLLQKYDYDKIIIPEGLPPRASLGYLALPVLCIMDRLELTPNNFMQDIQAAIQLLKKKRVLWSKEQNLDNPTWQIAYKIYQSYPLIYGEAEYTSVIARRLRSQLAENSKMLSGSHEFPELNHNEIVGFHNNPELLKNFGVIWLCDRESTPEIARRLTITREIIDPIIKYQISIQAEGSSFIERTLYLIHICDWISFWCAILHQEDPTPVNRINRLKAIEAR